MRREEWLLVLALAPVLFFGGLYLFAVATDNLVTQKTERDICQKRAATPYEYHQC